MWDARQLNSTKYVAEQDPSAMTKVLISALASPTGLNGLKLDSNSVQKRSQLLTQVGREGSNSLGLNQPRAEPIKKDRAYATLALLLEKVLVQSWK